MATQKENNPKAQALLKKFLAGECTPEELELLDNWYGEIGTEFGNGLSPELSAYYREQFLEAFRNGLPSAKVIWWKRAATRWTAAACMLVLAGISYFLMKSSAASTAAPATFLVTNTGTGPRLVVLPDSSHVLLNVAATLCWKSDYNKKIRGVQLTGEGFFEVNGEAGKPFIILTRDMTIRVLGTRFNVEAYAAEGMTRVSLVQGKVKVQAQKDSSITVVLQPGYAAAYYNGEKGISINETAAEKVTAWTEGAFSATDLPFRDAVQRLCTRYGYIIHWENVHGIDKNITVLLSKEDFRKTLESLCYINRKQYRVSGRQITIY
ncbi:MAG TPA: FecR domain-containing protein [Chitinophaga sp.]